MRIFKKSIILILALAFMLNGTLVAFAAGRNDDVVLSKAPPLKEAVDTRPYVQITCVLDQEGNTDIKKRYDSETIEKVRAYFTGLKKSTITMTPNAGGVAFTVKIFNGEKSTTYHVSNEKDGKGNAYCMLAANYPSSENWLLMKKTGAYKYLSELMKVPSGTSYKKQDTTITFDESPQIKVAR